MNNDILGNSLFVQDRQYEQLFPKERETPDYYNLQALNIISSSYLLAITISRIGILIIVLNQI